jgi:release factor glutamine methyltransferase
VNGKSEGESASVASLLQQGSKALSRGQIAGERIEAELFLAKVLGLRRIDLYLDPERSVKEEEQARFETFILERLNRKPAQHLLEEQEFWGKRFWTPYGVFIPRPETELLVETAAELFSRRPPAKILDIGTGSGCLSVALALLFTDAAVFALDRSLWALSVARVNGEAHGVADRIRFFCSDLTGTIRSVTREKFDLIVSNPPYLGDGEREGLQPEVVRHEPHEALFAGPSGLEAIARILADAPILLSPDGILLMEIGATQGEKVREIAEKQGFETTLRRDYAGWNRVALMRFPRPGNGRPNRF